MRMRIRLRRICLVVCCAFFLLFFGGCTQKYSLDMRDALYRIEKYEQSAIFTPSSTIQVKVLKTEVEESGLTAVCDFRTDEGDVYICFTFGNLTKEAASVRFFSVANRAYGFDVYSADEQRIGIICLASYDWSAGCIVLRENDNIKFVIN